MIESLAELSLALVVAALIVATCIRGWLIGRETVRSSPHLVLDMGDELDRIEWLWPERRAS